MGVEHCRKRPNGCLHDYCICPCPGCSPPKEDRSLLTDEQIRVLTLWETDEEIPAFRAGFRARMQHSPHDRAECPSAKMIGLYPESQNARVAWERGWLGADAMCRVMCSDQWLR